MFGKYGGGMKIAAALVLTAALAAPAAAGGSNGRESPREGAARVALAPESLDWAGLWNRTWSRFVEVLGLFEEESADTTTAATTDTDSSETEDHGGSIDPNG
jgi:hypothetical protein